jgi:hypothetical protein
MDQSYNGAERREFARVFKNFNLFFYFKDSKDVKADGTFIKDISKGGLRFTTSKPIKEGTQVVFHISVPLIAPKKLVLEGVVISVKTIAPSVHEIRARFNEVDDQAKQLLDMLEKRNTKG